MDIIPDYCKSRILILGCGNILLGDDGFGPAVVEYLQKNYKIPEDVCVIDAGTGVREILFVIALSEIRPKKIIVIDAVDLPTHGGVKRTPGEIFEISLDSIPKTKIDDFSMHQMPTSNLLKELQDFCKVKITVLVAQIENIPTEVNPTLSQSLISSIPKMCDIIMEEISCLEHTL